MSDEAKDRPDSASLAEIRERCLHWTVDATGRRVVAGSAYNRLFLRRVSVRITRRCLAMGISANTVTLLMMIAGIAGMALCIPHWITATLAGAAAFFLFDALDAVDGEIARWNASSSTKGLFLDKVSHLLVGYPSLGLPAMHYYGMHHHDLYLALAAVAIVTGLMGCTLREMCFRINAEASCDDGKRDDGNTDPVVPVSDHSFKSRFLEFCACLKSAPVISFPITKARVVHILAIGAILASYRGLEMPLVCLAWFYAGYGALRLLLEIPYFYHKRVVDVRHEKKVPHYRWPL